MVKSKKNSEAYFTISVVAKMLGVHQQTLRIYEKEGLIKPARTDGNTRLFAEKDVEDLKLILRLTNDLGVNLAGVGVILEMREKMKALEKEFEDRAQQIIGELTNQFMNYLKNNSCLPVVSFQKGLIITEEGDNKKTDSE